MFNFRKKEKMSEEEKNILKRVMMFYEMNKDFFVHYSKASEKRKIIINIFKSLNYDALPNLSSVENHNINENITIYRGISAKNNELLKKYVDDFINGEIFLGGRASIYGTGIYTVIGNLDLAKDYSSDGGKNNCGITIESKLSDDTKIIEKEKLKIIRKFLIEKLKNSYKNDINNFTNVLEDDGALAAILGYDAILVREKNYIIILNRSKLVINDTNLYEQLDNLGNNNSNNMKN